MTGHSLIRGLLLPILFLLGLIVWACNGTDVAKEPRTLDIAITEKNDSLLRFDSLEIILYSKDSAVTQVVLRGKLKSKDQLLNIPLQEGIGDSFTVSIKGFKAGKLTMEKEVSVTGNNEFTVKEVPVKKDTLIVIPPDTVPKTDSVPPKQPPALEVFGDTTIKEGQLLLAGGKVVNATDSMIEIKGAGLPRGALFRMNGRYQGEFSWTPDFDQGQSAAYAVTFSTMAGGLSLEKTVRITVLNVNRAPVLAPVKNQAVKENERLAFPVAATDPDGAGGLILSVDSLPKGALFAKDTFTWTPDYNQAGNYVLKFTVTDGELKDSQTVAITVGNFNRPPDLSASDTTIAENDSLLLPISTSDPDGQAPRLQASNLPQGSALKALDSLKGKWAILWQPSYTQGRAAPYEITLTAADDSLPTTRTIKITVTNVNRLPTANAGKDSILTINDALPLKGTASDPDGPLAKIEWDIGGAGNFIRVSKPDTLIKAPAAAAPAFACILRATDADGAVALDTAYFKVTAQTPVVKVGADTLVDPGKPFHLKATASDDGLLITKTWSCSDGAALTPSTDGLEADLRLSAKDDSAYRCIFKAVDDDGMAAADTLQIKAKFTWTQATDSAAFKGRDGAATVVFKDRMWVIGGTSYDGSRFQDIWSSADGKAWRLETDMATCLPRYGHTVVEFNGRLWLIGGSAPIGGSIFKSQSDVWSSFDGVNWTRVKDSAGFNPRENHTAVVFNNKIWIMGGEDTRKVAKSLGDVWSSADGSTWTLANATAFSPRVYHKSVVFNGKIWVVGGFEHSDILSSEDGITWTNNAIAQPFYPDTHFFRIAVHAGQVWAWEENRVWLSPDLSTWTESTSSAPFVGHLAPLVYHGKLWCFGGQNRGLDVVHSVWYNSPN